MRTVGEVVERLRTIAALASIGRAGEGRGAQALLVIFSCTVLAGIWATTGWIALDHRREIYSSATSELTGAQSVLRSNTERTYELVRSILAVTDEWLTKNNSDSNRGSMEDLANLVERMQSFEDDPIALRFVDENGYLFRIGERDAANVSIYVGDRDYFKFLKNQPPGSYYVGAAVTSRDSGSDVLPVTMRAHPNHLGTGYIVAAVRTINFSTTYAGLLISAPSEIGFVRDDGVILMAWPNEAGLVGRKAPGFSEAVARWDPNHFNNRIGSRILPSPDGSGPALVAYARLTHEPITVFATFDAADLNKKWIAGIYPLVGSALFSSVIVVLLAFRIIRLMQQNRAETARVGDALERAEAANIAKKNFLANMSHELRTPLNAVIGFAEVISAEVMGPIGNPTYKAYASDILDAGRHLLGIIKEILDIARIDAGTFETGADLVSVNECIEQCVTLTHHIADAKGVAVAVASAPQLPHVVCEPTHIKQVVLNILGNAIKFTPKGGRVTISVRGNDDGSLLILVEDTGIGIPRSRLADLFQPFSQVASSLSRGHEGLGLGLVHSKRIVDAHGGGIWLESDAGSGTRAFVVIPRERLAPVGAVYSTIPRPASPINAASGGQRAQAIDPTAP